MRDLISEWGPVLIAAVVVVFLLSIVKSSAVQNVVSSGIQGVFTRFASDAAVTTK